MSYNYNIEFCFRMEVDTLFRSDTEKEHVNRVPHSGRDLDILSQIHQDCEYRSESGLTIRLAGSFGFCQGVKSAVETALASVEEHQIHKEKLTSSRLFITGEIIHNPSINDQLASAGVEILPPVGSPERLVIINPSDWVIIPAFGIPLADEKALHESGCRVIDTTCGWVRRIWSTVSDYSRHNLVTVIHGKVEHEETRATASRAGCGYVVIRDPQSAQLLAKAIRRESPKASDAALAGLEVDNNTDLSWPYWFNSLFAGQCSSRLDPVSDLDRIGLVNQTTMLSTETESIAEILGEAMSDRLGRPLDESFFRTLDTFCPATQRRQNAVREMLQDETAQAMLVVGGFRSSNTAHLAQLAAKQIPAYHIEDATCLIDVDRIRHRIPGDSQPRESVDWRPPPPCTISVTAGASTPDSVTDQTILRLISLYGALLLFLTCLLGSNVTGAGASEIDENHTCLSCFSELTEKAELLDWRDGISPDLTVPDSSGYDALHVDLLVSPYIEDESVVGQVIWTVEVTDDALPHISFDFFDNMEILQTWINGEIVPCTRNNNRIFLELPTPAMTGDQVTATINYQGIPEMGYIWGFDVRYHNEAPIIYTSCEPIASRTWWPCKDRPDDKFTADLSFIVPDSMIAVSNGLLVETIPQLDGRTLYHWRENYPITSYLVSMTATNYAVFEDTYTSQNGQEMPLTFYAYPEDLERAQQDWSITAEAIGLMADLFGEYPFIDEKYGMAEYAWGGAMEHQTLSSMGDYFFDYETPNEWVVVHELAHQWWGNWVTCGTWRDIWLNEGFATYSEALWAEHRGGVDSLRAVMLEKKSAQFNGSIYDPNFVLNGTVYRKGAWALHMLRHIIGDEQFFAGIREYGQNHAYQNAVTADFQSVMEDYYGESLDWFFEQWIYQPGRPAYSAMWEPVSATIDGYQDILVTLLQDTSGPDYFKMPIDVRFYLPDGATFTSVLWDSLEEQQFIVHVPGTPDSLALDPMNWILADVKFVADVQSLPDDEVSISPTSSLIIGQPFPNPTRSTTAIPLHYRSDSILEYNRAGSITEQRLFIFDPSGRRVRQLGITRHSTGDLLFIWDGQTDRGQPAPGGVYFARPDAAAAGAGGQTRRILLVR